MATKILNQTGLSRKGSKPMPSAEYLRSRLNYDPETGKFTWKFCEGMSKRWNTRYARKEAGYLNKTRGYVVIRIDGVMYLAHRLAWLWMTGHEPTEEIDHVNRDKADNRFVNLREASRNDNMRNGTGGKRTVNFGLPRGVTPVTGSKGFKAEVRANGHSTYLGTYPTPEEAGEAARRAREQYHKDFAYHG